MITKIKENILLVMSLLTLAAPITLPVAVYAADASDAGTCKTNIGNKIGAGASATSNGTATINCQETGSVNEGIGALALKVVNIFSFVVGAIAVIMIIYGGFRYITSGGDSGSVGNAKNTLIYAIVGLVIVALAQIIVRVVLSTTNDAITA